MHITHIRTKLVLASLVLIAPLVIWHTVTQVALFRQSRAEATAAARDLAEHVADGCNAWVHSVVDLERTIGHALLDEHRIPERDASAHLSRLLSGIPAIRHIAVADARGIVFASDTPRLIGLGTSAYPCMRRVMQGDDWAVSDLLPQGTDDGPVFGVVAGIRDARRELQGMVLGLIDEEGLRTIMQQHIMLAHRVVMTDSKGLVVLACGCPELARDQRWSEVDFIRRALAGESCIAEDFEMAGRQVMLAACEPVPELGWSAAVLKPREEVMGPVRRQTYIRTLIVSVIVGLVVGTAAYVGNRLAKPVVALADTAARFGQGDFEARADVRTGDELERLGTSFNDMADAVQERRSQLNAALESERRQAEDASTLYTVAQGLVVAVALNERLEVIARALSSICGAERCAIFLRRGDRLVAAAGWGILDPARFKAVTMDIDKSARLVHDALVPGTPIVVPDASNDPRVDPEPAARLSLKGFLALPLVRRRHVVGLAILDNPGQAPNFSDEAVEAARGLAGLAAIAIENAQAIEKERNVAKALQASLLPPVPERAGRFRFSSGYHPAIEMAELGGDFYDLAPLPDGRVGLVIADVSGKGLGAAIFTAMGRYTLRAFASEEPGPASALTRTNKALTQTGSDWGFVTMFYGLLDSQTGHLVYANAGHPSAVVARASGEVFELPCQERRLPLGILGDVQYPEHEFNIAEGDVLVCYTDGVTEARRDGQQFEVGRLERVVRESRHLPPGRIAEAIYRAVLDFSRGRIQDDIALLVTKREEA